MIAKTLSMDEDERLARAFIGPNFIGVDRAMQYFPHQLTEKEKGVFKKFPVREATVPVRRKTHFLVPDFGFSILEMRRYLNRELIWFGKRAGTEEFLSVRANPRWVLIRAEANSRSCNKTWLDQNETLLIAEYVPDARTLINAALLVYLTIGVRIISNVAVRCADTTKDGGHVFATFDINGICVDSCPDSVKLPTLGIAACQWL